jgi:hypothetical protein
MLLIVQFQDHFLKENNVSHVMNQLQFSISSKENVFPADQEVLLIKPQKDV